ncbi:MAG: hypothetical protein RIK87_21785 [Fuerstiella sp.]
MFVRIVFVGIVLVRIVFVGVEVARVEFVSAEFISAEFVSAEFVSAELLSVWWWQKVKDRAASSGAERDGNTQIKRRIRRRRRIVARFRFRNRDVSDRFIVQVAVDVTVDDPAEPFSCTKGGGKFQQHGIKMRRGSAAQLLSPRLMFPGCECRGTVRRRKLQTQRALNRQLLATLNQ